MEDWEITLQAYASLQRKHPTLIRKGFGFECECGWISILERMFTELDRLVPVDVEFRLRQVKQKFGALRVYYHLETDDEDLRDSIRAVVALADARSHHTCERCGRPGKLRDLGHWYFVACDKCTDERSEGYEAKAVVVDNDTFYVQLKDGWVRYDLVMDSLVPSDPPPWARNPPGDEA